MNPAYGHVTAVCVGGWFLGVRRVQNGALDKEMYSIGESRVNCRGADGAGDQKCLVQERQVDVSRVTVVMC